MYRKGAGWKAVDRIDLAHRDRDKWRCIINVAMNVRVPKNARNLNG